MKTNLTALELLDFLTDTAASVLPNESLLMPEIRALVEQVKKAVIKQTTGLRNLLLNADSYKASHWLQYPPNTRYVYSYIESRGGELDTTVFFGLQGFIKDYLNTTVTFAMIDEAEAYWTAHGEPFNRAGWEYIVREHNGRLPISIKAVPEGTVIAGKNVLVSIVNTDPNCFWLPSFLETALLRAVWYPVTVATNSYQCKQVIKEFLVATSDDPEGQIAFKLHDFGARGVSSLESAAIGGAAHLVNFMGTDTMSGIVYLREFYGAVDMPAFSVPAAEHSTITSWGRENEAEAYRNMLRQFAKPGSIVAVVSDSYDIYNAVENIWGETLKQEVIDSGATLVVRPDSGDPEVVPVDCVELLAKKFGYTVNKKGYKVLPVRADGTPVVRVIQGDGVNIASIRAILQNLKDRGFSAENITFGMGGKLLQALDRDTLKFAMKCSAIDINGTWVDVYKDPATDTGKRSKRGRLALVTDDGVNFKTVRLEEAEPNADILVEVYRDGEVTKEYTLAEIRQRAA